MIILISFVLLTPCLYIWRIGVLSYYTDQEDTYQSYYSDITNKIQKEKALIFLSKLKTLDVKYKIINFLFYFSIMIVASSFITLVWLIRKK